MIQLFNIARGAFNATSADTVLTDLTETIGDTLTLGLATLFGLVAVLIGLFFVLRLVKKYIGRGK